MAIAESGNIFYIDEHDTQFSIIWETVNGNLDITETIKTPFLRLVDPEGFIKNNTVFRKGEVSIHRQVIRQSDGEYEIIAEGSLVYVDYIQTNFPCSVGSVDQSKYHLDCALTDENEIRVTDGPHFTDPDPDDTLDEILTVWAFLDSGGNSTGEATGTGGVDTLEWIDVWSN